MPDAVSARVLLVVRHGRTAWNAEGRIQGQADVGLDAVGRRQAQTMARTVARLGPTVLVSSDLARARETAAFLEKETGLTAREDARLREFALGDRTGLTREEYLERTGRTSAVWDDAPLHEDVDGAETPEQVRDRMVPALRASFDAVAPGECGVVVTHGAALRVGLAGLLGWPPKAATTLAPLPNCAWAELRQTSAAGIELAAYGVGVGGPPDSRPS